MEDYKIIDDVVKVYPDHMKITIYHKGYTLEFKRPVAKQEKTKEQKEEDNIHRSIRRTRERFKDIILTNRFQWFMTFTFDSKKHNRFDVDHCKLVMQMWLRNQKKMHSPALEYLLVPEFHKKCEDCVQSMAKECPHDDAPKAIHFHALINNFNGRLNPVLNKKTGQQLTSKSGAPVFDIPGFRAGRIRSALKLTNNYDAIAGYMQKYMTKDMPIMSGKKRYWCSRGLQRPTKMVNGVFKLGLYDIIKGHKPAYINDFLEVQIHNHIKATDLRHTGKQLSFTPVVIPDPTPPPLPTTRKLTKRELLTKIPAH